MKVAPIEVTLIDHMGTDLSVVNAARVSFHKESNWEKGDMVYDYGEPYWSADLLSLSDKDKKLINYLAKNKHTSPFNHTFITCRVKAPIFVARQLVKHRFMPWNEVSRRYVDDEPEYYLPTHWRARPDNGIKQGSSEEAVHPSRLHFEWDEYTDFMPKDVIELAHNYYMMLIANGICPEQARMVLPQNTMTEWIWSGTLGAYADMLRLRLDPHAQYESRLVAEKIRTIVSELFPVSLAALLGETNDGQTGAAGSTT